MVMNTSTLHFVLHCYNKYKLIFFVLNKVQDMLVGAAFLQKKKKKKISPSYNCSELTERYQSYCNTRCDPLWITLTQHFLIDYD